VVLCQEMDEAFRAGGGTSLTGQFYFRREEIASEHGGLLPGVEDAMTSLITAAIWFGVTTGYLALAGSCHVPRRFLV